MPEGHAVVAVGVLDEGPAVMVAVAALLPPDSPRVEGVNAEHVRVLVSAGAEVPPIVVHRGTMRVIDGMHRLRAAVLRGQETIAVRFFDGADRDLFALAVALNAGHGLPLTHKDRVVAATRLVRSHAHWSDRVLGQLTGLSPKTVAAIRRRSAEEVPRLNGRVGRDGIVRPLNVDQGRLVAGQLMRERPNASLREIARETGLSLGTVRDVRRRLQHGEDLVPARRRRMEWVEHRQIPVAGQGEPAAGASDAVAITLLFEQLTRDPSLRLSVLGRTVLRLLGAHLMSPAAWAQLVESVPAHSVGAIASVARSCADSWLRFADLVEHRGVRSVPESE